MAGDRGELWGVWRCGSCSEEDAKKSEAKATHICRGWNTCWVCTSCHSCSLVSIILLQGIPSGLGRNRKAKLIRNAQISYFCFGNRPAVLRSTQTIFSLRRQAWLPISRYWKRLTNGKSRKWAQMMSLSGILPSGKAYSMYHLYWLTVAITNNGSHNVATLYTRCSCV